MSWHWDFGDGKTSASQDPVHAFANPGDYPVTLTVTTPHGSVTSSQIMSVTASETLRIISSHPFDVTLSATDPRTGATGQGQVISQTDIYGLFSIPDITGNAGNPEVIVKMVDASGIGQSYWVFFGALTDLTYTLTVTEVATGHTKTYHNAQVGSTVCGQFDTSGFDFIPTPTPPAPTPTPTAPPAATPPPTPTAPAKIVVNLVATEFEWNFDGAGPNFTDAGRANLRTAHQRRRPGRPSGARIRRRARPRHPGAGSYRGRSRHDRDHHTERQSGRHIRLRLQYAELRNRPREHVRNNQGRVVSGRPEDRREDRGRTMKRTRTAALAVFGLIAALGVTLFATERQEGPSALFKEFCARCHGEDGTGNTPKGKQLMARDFTDADWRSAKSDADLIKAIVAGGESMPAFGKKLTPEQIESLVKNDIRGFARKK